MTVADQTTTITVPAPNIKVGDRIDEREVEKVTGREKRSYSTRNRASGSVGALPNVTYGGHVVCVYFTDQGAPKYYWGTQTVEVRR